MSARIGVTSALAQRAPAVPATHRKTEPCRTQVPAALGASYCLSFARHSRLSAHACQRSEGPHQEDLPQIQRRWILGAAAWGAALGAPQLLSARPAQAVEVIVAGEDEGRVELLPSSAAAELSLSEKQILEYNKRIQAQNRVPREFPWFVREGFDVKIIADDFSITKDGLLTRTFQLGTGPRPGEGQKAIFHYTAYNESGSPIDSSYKQGRPSEMRVGSGGVIPGFELAIKEMEVGTQMRVIVPPALGPPVGPSTFFSAKQCEVFDIEMLALKNCSRKQFGMVSNIVCDDV